MITVVLYKQFNKDINSTKLPASAAGTTYQADIYDPCSIINPVIILNVGGTELQTQGYNYAWIPNFGGRFYWITDMIYQEGRWFVHLDVDVLATYKAAIGETTQYVLRASSQYDEWITDDLYPTNSGESQLVSSITGSWPNDHPFASQISTGIFICGIVGGTPTFGAVRYYAFTISQFNDFVSYLLGNTGYLGDLGDITDDMAKLILNPLQYVQSCFWFPYAISPLGGSVSTIRVGWWDVTCSASLVTLNDNLATSFLQFTFPSVPVHPQAATIGAYLRRSPYSHYRIWVPPIGLVDIPADLFYDVTSVDVYYHVDLISGKAVVDLYGTTSTAGAGSKHLHSASAQLAVEVPIAQILGTANYIVQGGRQIMSGEIFAGIHNIVHGGIGAWLGTQVSGGSIQGGAGTTSVFGIKPTIELTYTPVAESAPALLGRPLCQLKRIDTLSGFIMCGHAHVSIYRAIKQELEQIETFMNEGFYYE